ncbi:MAG: putative 3-hydroxyacyl-CoA dehydrogenase [Cyanobacteria bacterium RYN_339]|nr:putative 3-hydroxyacyl-CoA dehydrogenase [Cyanobacteria bacterium RYN_339]
MGYIYKAAVIGGGTMGGGIAQVISFSGLPVIIKDINQDMVDKGIEAARQVYASRVSKGKMTQNEMDQKMMLISGTTTYEGFDDVDLVIEAVTERMDIKKAVFKELDEVCPASCILTSNTSALSISELGAATKRPDKVIGMHFFNPAPVMKLVEIIPGLETSEDTINDVMEFTSGLRKMPVRVEECAGFLVNRLLMPFFNEAVFAAQEGAASLREIDKAVTDRGMPMGPFFLADMLGVDVCYHVQHILHEEYGTRMAPAKLIDKLYAAKRWGAKTGAGFYVQDGTQDEAFAEKAIAEVQAETGIKGTSFSFERLILPMINEAAYALQEKVASPNDIDIAMMAGAGMADKSGPKGPLALADEMGLDVVVAKLEELQAELGERFRPAPLLKRKVRAGHLGVKTRKGFKEYSGELETV